MKKPLIWLSFIALTATFPASAGMLGAPVPSSKKEPPEEKSAPAKQTRRDAFQAPQKSTQQSSQKRTDTRRSSRTPSSQTSTLDPKTAKQLESYGVDPKEAKEFLEKTKNMSPQELQQYLSSLKKGLESGDVAPGDVDQTISKDYKPYPKKSKKKKSKKSIRQQQNEEAFDELMAEVLPLSPTQIQHIHKYYDLTLQAKATPPNAPPSPNFVSLPVNLEPGSQSPIIRLSAGFVSTILFVDRTGAPWPISAYSLGDPNNFNIQWDNQSNTMFVQSTKRYVHANMAVRLVGLNTPVMLTLVSGQKNVDFRVDLQMQARGPEAFPAVIEKGPMSSQVNSEMINVLDGVPPSGSLKLTVNGGPGQAWLFNNKIYYRSKLTLLSPAWLATVSSPDGMHVYEIMPTPFLLASKDGKTINIKLTGL